MCHCINLGITLDSGMHSLRTLGLATALIISSLLLTFSEVLL